MFNLFGSLLEEFHQLTRIRGGGVLGPFCLNRSPLLVQFDNEVDFRAILGAQMIEPSRAQVLEPFPQLDTNPLLENRTGVGFSPPRLCGESWPSVPRRKDINREEEAW